MCILKPYLWNVDFSVIHEVEDRVEVVDGDALQVEERVQLVLVVSQDPAKQGRAGSENNLVGLDLKEHMNDK